jgi:hypothetical protein
MSCPQNKSAALTELTDELTNPCPDGVDPRSCCVSGAVRNWVVEWGAEGFVLQLPGVEQRRRPDRRFYRRGGRRPADSGGFSPLVMVVEADVARRTLTERILASSHFAVAPVASIESALSICRGLVPSVIVCNERDEPRVRAGLEPRDIPIVGTNVGPDALDRLIDRIRDAVRRLPAPAR